MSSANSHSSKFPSDFQNLTRREFIAGLAAAVPAITGLTLLGEPALAGPTQSPNQLHRATVDIAVQALNLVAIAGLHEDGEATVEEVRAELVGLRTAVETIVI